MTGPPVGMFAQCAAMITVKFDIVTDHYWDDCYFCRLIVFFWRLFCFDIDFLDV